MDIIENSSTICDWLTNIGSNFSLLWTFLSNEKFVFPFFSTLGATLAILLLQFTHRYVTEKKKKIYSTSYIYDVCARLIEMNFILLKHTINPHIDATEQILEGNTDILGKMFSEDEFDILRDKHIKFNVLPDEYKILLGCDDIELVQSYETLCYFIENDIKRKDLNLFVGENLKSITKFNSFTTEEKIETINSYLDHLYKIKHESYRTLWLILYVIIPKYKDFITGKQFLFFTKKSISNSRGKIIKLLDSNEDLLPSKDYMESARNGGIQNEL